jgi:hypothetical protein
MVARAHPPGCVGRAISSGAAHGPRSDALIASLVDGAAPDRSRGRQVTAIGAAHPVASAAPVTASAMIAAAGVRTAAMRAAAGVRTAAMEAAACVRA